MKVYEGMLRGGSGRSSWPRSWLVVAVQPAEFAQAQGSRLRSSGLSMWAVITLCRTKDGILRSAPTIGETAADFWTMARAWLESNGPHWMFSEHGVREWTMLGLWELLLRGDVQLSVSGPIRRRHDRDRGMGREPGMLMSGDPPTAGRFQWAEGGQSWTWVSARNYGRQPEEDSKALVARADRLADWTCEIDAALYRLDVPGWKPTLGGMAWHGWKSTYDQEPIYRSRATVVTGLETAARAGGVMLPAIKGREWNRCYHLDARGLYSWIAGNMPLPIGASKIMPAESGPYPLPLEESEACLARAVLSSGLGRFPSREAGRLRYTKGRCASVLAGPELTAAQRLGLVEELGEYVRYRMGSPLADFQKRVYAERCQAEANGQKDVANLCKGLGVAVVGKFAGRAELWEECQPDYADPLFGRWFGTDEKGRQVVYEASPAGVSRCRHVGDAWNAVPCLALWVWSYGRNWMWTRIEAAGQGNVIYAHTDGMIVTLEGALNLEDAGYIRNQEWGELRRLDGPVRVVSRKDGILDVGGRLIAPGIPLRGRDALGELTGGSWFRVPTATMPEEYLSGRIPESTRQSDQEGWVDDE